MTLSLSCKLQDKHNGFIDDIVTVEEYLKFNSHSGQVVSRQTPEITITQHYKVFKIQINITNQRGGL